MSMRPFASGICPSIWRTANPSPTSHEDTSVIETPRGGSVMYCMSEMYW